MEKHEPPQTVTGKALEKWNEIINSDHYIKSFDVLAAYCIAYGRNYDMETWLSEGGPEENRMIATIRDDKGNIKSFGPSPQLLIAEKACKEMTRLGKSLGLNN